MHMLARPVVSRRKPVIVVRESVSYGRSTFYASLKNRPDTEVASAYAWESLRLLLAGRREAGESGWLPDYKVTGVINR